MPRIKVELSAEFITPCFGGGVSSNTSVSNAAELRETSIRGQIRWWMQACGMSQENVAKLLGSTDTGQSPVRFRKKKLIVNRSETEDWWTDPQYRACVGYLWFFAAPSTAKTKSKNESNRVGQKCLSKGSKFTIELSCRPEQKEDLKKLVAYSILWITFGSIGSRSTRAGGCMKFLGIKEQQNAETVLQGFQELEKLPLAELWKVISTELGLGENPAIPFELRYSDDIRLNDSNAPLNWFAQRWKLIREDLKGDQKAFWGLPFKDIKAPTKFTDDKDKPISTERMTSHIHLRPLKINDTFYPAALIFNKRMVLKNIDEEAGNRVLKKHFPKSVSFSGGDE
ncbi:type III-B CRISPR module RAMP protein Cmr1 [Desulfovibrio gilichinskyi]|uniref:CRISPR-associated protein Cmr1 n=1 Tax=Desulfovibrio gilichinskyi TaxID=1519643 RepID=A0A1X7D6R7_9BACT|nr:type III-B CRISPR module RAMP protein Cmr1 [Desulfovibrio gilichinskyi]SMF09902.1 CRISPR-associated protein Cmr1 [Desulfovibrio gilichinskyi]